MAASRSVGRTLATAIVVMLIAALGVSWVTTVQTQGPVASIPTAASLYMAVVLAVAIHLDHLRSPNFHVAFFLGVAVWALDSYWFRAGSALALLVLVIAIGIILVQGRRWLDTRQSRR